MIQETVQIFKSSYAKLGIKLTYLPIDKNLFIQGDPAKIQQVFFHLLANSKTALEGAKKKEITIRTQAIGSQFLSLKIQDTGIGIKEEYRTKIYDAFFTTHTNKDNRGLGLSVVTKIVKAHHGSVNYENNIDGNGVTFFIRIPLLRK